MGERRYELLLGLVEGVEWAEDKAAGAEGCGVL